MKLRTLKDVDVRGKTILYRAPYDIGVEEVDGKLVVKDDLRIKGTLPTLRYLIEQNCKIVILTYVKRPDGQVVEKLRTTPHAKRLSELLGKPVDKADDCVGEKVEAKIAQMKPGELLMLENVRFYKEENEDDDEFAKQLAHGKDLIVFDGFPQAMRIHASTTGIERHLPAVAGLYLEGEVNMLGTLLENPSRPFTVIIGGAKISDKVDAVNNLLPLADKVLVGGAVANVFLKARGLELGKSFVEDVFVDSKRREKRDWVEYAKEILEKYKDKIVYPKDSVISDGTDSKTIRLFSKEIPRDWSAFDIGPATVEYFGDIIKTSGTVFLAGPMGKFEEDKFGEGSRGIIAAFKEAKGNTIIAGGDTIAMAQKYGDLRDFSHVSLAGGATLDFLAGKELPALIPLIKP
ncbi:MAG: phosphoglycerate kinase [Parcubacteria group bacterium GW2011_GWA1_47_11]|uniref:Phosphoglycerate kinase n=1 Tax=Candidatus Nomurabacteria bacterium GW2011_GWB1_47_6 TaxID=1618749 RepID=A0A0G1W0U3_9BACT|nr:MAG: phosphoglycerate kinase [Parcubacteria group bacterium GW2011_GWA1_47_11]KKU75920.1 MAG: phosphoglycerate kinase [Candidatus Nomurabacteria bacterium GW2011_GWB1_47_6]